MKTIHSLIYVSLFWSPVYLYNVYRPNLNVCPKNPEKMKCDCCQNQMLMPFLESRLADQKTMYPVTSDYAYNLETRNARLPSFFSTEDDDRGIDLADQKNINVGYLNLGTDGLKSINDFIDFSSEELISTPNKNENTGWNLGQDDEPASPKFLPDILATPENQNERPVLGQKGYAGNPPPITDLVQMEKSEMTQETRDMGNRELDEMYYRKPSYMVPEIILETVAQRPMTYTAENPLQNINMEPFTEEDMVLETTTQLPPLTTPESNFIPKGTTTRKPKSSKRKSKSKSKETEAVKIKTETTTQAPILTTEKTPEDVTEQAVNMSSRFNAVKPDTIFEGLLKSL